MALTTDYEDIRHEIERLGQDAIWSSLDRVNKRLDALVEAVEVLARERYEYPALPESKVRNALSRARGR